MVSKEQLMDKPASDSIEELGEKVGHIFPLLYSRQLLERFQTRQRNHISFNVLEDKDLVKGILINALDHASYLGDKALCTHAVDKHREEYFEAVFRVRKAIKEGEVKFSKVLYSSPKGSTGKVISPYRFYLESPEIETNDRFEFGRVILHPAEEVALDKMKSEMKQPEVYRWIKNHYEYVSTSQVLSGFMVERPLDSQRQSLDKFIIRVYEVDLS